MKNALKKSDRVRLLGLALAVVGLFGSIYFLSIQRIGILPKAAEEGPHVRLFFDRDAPLKRGKDFSLILKLNPQGASLYGFEVMIRYDGERVELSRSVIDDLTQAFNAEAGFFKRIEQVEEGRAIRVYGAKLGGDPISGTDDIELAKIRFKVKETVADTDEIAFSWDRQETKIAGDKVAVAADTSDAKLTLGEAPISQNAPVVEPTTAATQQQQPVEPVIEPTVLPTVGQSIQPTILPPSPTPQQPPAQGVSQGRSITLLLRTQGIVARPKNNSLRVAVTIAGGSLTQPISEEATFTADDKGIWKGTLSFASAPKAAGYVFFLKGEHHVKEKICHEAPVEKQPGSYSCSSGQISVTDGSQTLDFSGVLQLGGDLAAQNSGQDGKVNANDAAFVRNHLLSTDPAVVKSADINKDGIVNVIDNALIFKTLERGVTQDAVL